MLRKYQNFKFRAATLAVIDQANEIIEEYIEKGYDLTLRQLYYQFVARALIENSQKEYKKLGKAINNGRLAGLIDWDAIKDRTRSMEQNHHWSNPESLIDACAEQFAVNTRSDQDVYIEAWVEKEALVGVVERVCQEIDIPWFACRGFVSQSAMYEAACRCRVKRSSKNILILHLGDHDPSGVDMTRDNFDRMEMFGINLEVNRIALNMDQIEEYSPPPNPVKLTDSRSQPYIDKYGEESWELDALDPDVLSSLIRDETAKHTDEDRRQDRIKEQNEGREMLYEVSVNWEEIVEFLRD